MHLYGFLQDFVKHRPLMVTTNLAFSLLIPVQDIMLPHFYGKLIDSLTNNADIFMNVVYVLSIFVMLELGYIISDWHDIKTSAGFQTFTRQEILRNLMHKYEKNFADLYLGSLMSKVVKIPYTLVIWYERLKYHIIPYVLVFGFGVWYFASYDKFLGAALLVTAIIYAIVILGVPQYFCRGYAVEKDQMVNEIHEEIDDTLRNFIAMHGDIKKQEQEVHRLDRYEKLFTTKFAETMKCLMKTKVYTSLIVLLFTGTFILRSYALFQKKKMTTANFSSMFLILIYLTNTMMSLENQLREMIFDWGVIAESDELFEKPSAKLSLRQNDKPSEELPKNGIGMKHISFSFPGGGRKILKDITFHIEKGQTVVILGDIGSGKSTILKLLLKFNEPDGGDIYVNGQNYNNLDIREVKKKVGYVPQQPALFNRTVIENITYGTEGVTREQVQDFIKQIGVDKEFVNLENGIDTKVGKNGSRLSGGQRQVVWCLRTFFQNPDIVILDEPTASLDKKSKETLKVLLEVIMKDKTVVIVTHDDGLLEIAERRLRVVNGSIVEEKNEENLESKSNIMTNSIHKIFGNGSFVMKGGLLAL